MNREQIISANSPDDDRVQYDGEDNKRIARAASLITDSAVMMIQALGEYTRASEAPVDENSADAMKAARYDVTLCWGALQLATSKIASVLRIDGDEVFSRMVESGLKQEDPNLEGL